MDVSQWVEEKDPRTKKLYWGNLSTRETTWKEPDVVKTFKERSKDLEYLQGYDEKVKKAFFVEKGSKLKVWIKPLGKIGNAQEEALGSKKETWVECFDEKSNRSYYFNVESKKVTWKKPNCSERIISAEEYRQKVSKKKEPNEIVQVRQKQREEDEKTDDLAVITSEGSVKGWVGLCAEDGTFSKLFCVFAEAKLNFFESEREEYLKRELQLGGEMHVELSAEEEDEKESEYEFVINVQDTSQNDCQNTKLGLTLIEDMQVWLEALQLEARRKRVSSIESPRNTQKDEVTSSTKIFDEASSVLKQRKIHGSLSPSSPNQSAVTQSWSTFEEWASEHGFDCYINSFREAGFDDLQLLAALEDGDVKEILAQHLNLEKPGHRMKLVLAIRQLRKANA